MAKMIIAQVVCVCLWWSVNGCARTKRNGGGNLFLGFKALFPWVTVEGTRVGVKQSGRSSGLLPRIKNLRPHIQRSNASFAR